MERQNCKVSHTRADPQSIDEERCGEPHGNCRQRTEAGLCTDRRPGPDRTSPRISDRKLAGDVACGGPGESKVEPGEVGHQDPCDRQDPEELEAKLFDHERDQEDAQSEHERARSQVQQAVTSEPARVSQMQAAHALTA